jgi:hypothetical protein
MNLFNSKLALFFILAVSLTVAADFNESCPLFRCSQVNMEGDFCTFTSNVNVTNKDGSFYQQTVTEIDTSRCQNGDQCPTSTRMGYVSCQPRYVGLLVDGESCSSSSQCYSGNCRNNKTCIGLDNGALCSNTGQCKVGSFCTGFNTSDPASICKEQLRENATCSSSNDCINSHSCINGTCTALFSLPEGTPITTSMSDLDCQSVYTYGNICTNFVFLGNRSYLVEANGTCSYNWTARNAVEIFQGGECSWDGTFNKYCSRIGTDHDLFVEYKRRIRDYYFGEALTKHSFRRSILPNEIYNVYNKVFNWPHLINADKCALALFGANSVVVNVSILSLLSLMIFFLF